MTLPEARLVDLSQLRGPDLEPLLEAQRAHWSERLAWNYGDASDMIRRLLDQRRLAGLAALAGGRPVGYSYFTRDAGKAVVGEVFVLPAARAPHLERLLLEMTIIMASRGSGVHRVEGQLASFPEFPDLQMVVPGELQVYPRRMLIKESPLALAERDRVKPDLRFLPWTGSQLGAVAELIAHAYLGHVDANISEEYRSASGARRFLEQTINQPGSGRFLAEAGVLAQQAASSKLAGICLGSMVEAGVGHITQLCVAPQWAGFGIGSELLRRALDGFERAGCDAVSLTVTVSNERAMRLYERNGFRTMASFPAFVWSPQPHAAEPGRAPAV